LTTFWLPPEHRAGDLLSFPPEEAHHILHVLRKKEGDEVEVICGGQRLRVELLLEKGLRGRIISAQEIPSPKLTLDLAQGLPKGKKMEQTLKLASQIGIRNVFPLISARTVPKKSQETAKVGRWRRILEEEAKVTGFPPTTLGDLTDLDDLLRKRPQYDIGIFLWENSQKGLKALLKEVKEAENCLLIVGPEGGFTPQEATEAGKNGFEIISLGQRIYRTEIAGVIASIILLEHWGDLGQ